MKTKGLLFTIMLFSITAFSQVPGKRIDGPITILDTLQVKVGDNIYLGRGTGADGNFIYFFEMKLFEGRIAAPNGMAGRSLQIIALKVDDDIKMGKKYYAVVKPSGEIQNWGIDLESAIKYGEVIGLNSLRFDKSKPASTTTIINNKGSVADELKKLKDLKDQGVITNEEYEAQKKKLLNN